MVDPTSQITKNLTIVQEQIEKAAIISGRESRDISLVVVSKAQPIHLIVAAYQCGVRKFGENYPQEAEKKITSLEKFSEIEWHMIGHLQSRKVPIVANHFHYIHSIDRLDLAEKLNRVLVEKQKILPAFLEVKISEEVSKSGWPAADMEKWCDLISDFRSVSALSNLKIRGLMTMPPYFDDPEMARPYFRKMRKLRDYLNSNLPSENWKELSMGTSGDFQVAIEEGATFVRIGQAILGPRPEI